MQIRSFFRSIEKNRGDLGSSQLAFSQKWAIAISNSGSHDFREEVFWDEGVIGAESRSAREIEHGDAWMSEITYSGKFISAYYNWAAKNIDWRDEITVIGKY